MKITIWGTRGSLPAPSPENNQYGGNTSCVQVTYKDTMLILDAGSGIRRLGSDFPPDLRRIDILLTHLHMDHIMGLGFFLPLYNPALEINIWGPTSTREPLINRLQRYLSPPLFPIRLQDLPSQPNIIELNHSSFSIGSLQIQSAYVCHPGPTVGYRIESPDAVLTYIPDHEPALGAANFPNEPEWTSGYELAKDADLLLHDAQYTPDEYTPRVGWGHSSIEDALRFAEMAAVKRLLFFHHDPSHTDEYLHHLMERALHNKTYAFKTGIAAEGDSIVLP
ncbi:MAG: MBL fold metallo-hydrolase [Bacteroidetes bacterium]|nr:MAG: MBL fold metallo-hydrolase [Bacteroidota bacterium]